MKREMITLTTPEGLVLKVPSHVVATTFVAAALAHVGVPGLSVPAANQSVPALGEYWPGQGGVNAGLVRGVDGGADYYLIVCHGDDLGELKYGGYGTDIKGTSSASDGLANTQALIGATEHHPAAQACIGYSCDGHNDFYLPARRELQIAEANVPEVFSQGWHWSSSQRSADYAFHVGFDVGGQYGNVKDYEFRVRPVRRLFI